MNTRKYMLLIFVALLFVIIGTGGCGEADEDTLIKFKDVSVEEAQRNIL
jgi:hypothetical protein